MGGDWVGRGNSACAPSRQRDHDAQARPADAHGPVRDADDGSLRRCGGTAQLASGGAAATDGEQLATGTIGDRARQQDADMPIWMQPPSWMYLPHLYHPWTPRGGTTCRQRSAEEDDAGHARAARRQISGRAPSPGARPAEAARSDAESVAGIGNTIRGPAERPGLCSGSARTGSGDRAQQRLDAQNAHLRHSLEAHAERVAQKRARADQRGGAATAAERLDAVRRRVADRISARERHGQGYSAAAVPEAGASSSVVSAAGRIELRYQIHLQGACTGIHDDPACRGGGGGVDARVVQGSAMPDGADDAGVGEGGPSMSSDAAHQASRVAWHDVALLTDRGR
jgi:hypothetical protein